MNYRDFICFDLETTSADPLKTQPVQIAAIVIDGRKLTIKHETAFQSLIKPIFDEQECEDKGLDSLQDGAVAVHGKTREILENAPDINSVWKNFTEWVSQFNPKKSNWMAPIPVGYNIRNFDIPIINRVMSSDPYNLGPLDNKKRPSLFHPVHMVDAMDFSFLLFENDKDVNSLSADNLIRGHMGYAHGQAHDAMSDVIMTADWFCVVMKMIRVLASKKKFKGLFSEYKSM